MHTETYTTAAILAGGASTRMGTNKALLRLRPGGPTLIEMVAHRLREAGFARPLLITNASHDYAFLGLTCVPDDLPGCGPLGGLYTALSHSQSARTLLIACDMPFLSSELLRYMAALPGEAEAWVPRWVEDGEQRLEPLHSIYSQACKSVIEARLNARRFGLIQLLDNLNAHYIEEPVLRKHDPRLQSFHNVNTVKDWEAALLISAAPGSGE